MKNIVFFLAGLLWSSLSFGQKQINDPDAQLRKVSGFHAIRVSNGIELYLSQGTEETVAVSAADPEYREKMITEVVEGELKIYYEDSWWKKWGSSYRKKLKAYVSFRALDKIKAVSGASVKVEGKIEGNNLQLDASSGATFEGIVALGGMQVNQSSGSVVSVSGKITGMLKVDGSSGSVFKGYDLVAEDCDAETSSGAGIQVTVNRELSVHATSGGYIHYKGNGLIRNVKTNSGGSVSRKS